MTVAALSAYVPPVPLVQDLTHAHPPARLAPDRVAALLPDLCAARARLGARRDDGSLPLLHLPTRADDLERAAPVAGRLAQADRVLVLGIGGSSLGAQTVLRLADRGFGPRPGRPPVHVLESIDPASFLACVGQCRPERTAVLVVSKSGGTAETLAQFLTLQELWGRRLDPALTAVLTEPAGPEGANPLRLMGERLGATLLDHDPGVGGRYSVLSLVGALPGMIAGLDMRALRAGAAAVLDATLDATEAGPVLHGAAWNLAAAQAGLTQTILMPYSDGLADLGLWWRQLWAESLGKGGRGTTPIRAIGPVDQHSQLQLYLDGPADKIFTLIGIDPAGLAPVPTIPASAIADTRLGWLAGSSLGDLLDAERRATLATLAKAGRPLRHLALPALDEYHLGGLFMHFMLETILVADQWGVDPFDQPAVEEGKRLARASLQDQRRA